MMGWEGWVSGSAFGLACWAIASRAFFFFSFSLFPYISFTSGLFNIWFVSLVICMVPG
jgi:hypothetical protein